MACRLGFPSYNLSVSLRSTAPLVGEPLAKPFTLRGLPKPPLGRGGGSASALTERLSSAAAHGQALLRTTSQSASLDKAGLRLPASASLPLASCWPRPQQLLPVSATGGGRRRCPQRGSPWHVGQLSSGRAKHNISEAAVLRCLGQRQLDKERCPEAAALCSKARHLASCRTSGVQWKVNRPAKASPFGRGGIAKQ